MIKDLEQALGHKTKDAEVLKNGKFLYQKISQIGYAAFADELKEDGISIKMLLKYLKYFALAFILAPHREKNKTIPRPNKATKSLGNHPINGSNWGTTNNKKLLCVL